MNPELTNLVRAASAPLLGWLLTYAIHSTILLAAAWLLASRTRSHRVREVLWKTALFGAFVTAFAQSALRVIPLTGRMVVQATAPAAQEPSASPDQASPSLSRSMDPEPSRTATPPSDRLAGSPALGLGDGVAFAWIFGVTILVGGYLFRRRRFTRNLASRRPVMTHPLAEMLEELSAEAGIIRPIRLTASPALSSPIALGAGEIAVPEAALTELDRDQQRGMLAHELAHLERRDPAWLAAACLAERIGFFQPLNRLARRRIQESAEYLSDEWAVGRTGSGVFLARCLAKVAEWMDAAPRAVPVAGMAEERSHLVARVRRLLDSAPFPRSPGRRTLAVASLVAVALTVVAVPGVSLAHRQADDQMGTADQQDEVNAASQVVSDSTRAIVLALIGALKDTDVGVRRAAVQSLSRFDDPISLPAFREALRDADAEVRAQAAEALGERKDRASAPALADALRDESAEVRRAAAGALGEIPNSGAREPLLAALKDPDAEVREHAIVALARLGDQGAIDGLTGAIKDPKPDVRAKAIEALMEFDLAAPPAGLLEALRDPHPDVRHQAAHAAGHFHDERAVPTLRALLEDSNGDVRTAAVEALGEIRTEAAIQALVAALKAKDPEVRRAAADALGKR